jgi:hypothetical protein
MTFEFFPETGPGTPPLNVPLSASARVAALRAKRAGLGALSLTSSPTGSLGEAPRTTASNLHFSHLNNKRMSWGSVASAGPPPTTPLPPVPMTPATATSSYAPSSYATSVVSDGNGKRKSVTLNSPTTSSYPFPSKFDMTTPTNTTFHRSTPSGATFGHGVGPNFFLRDRDHASRTVDHSRASSFGSATEGGRGTSTVGDFGEFKLGMNANVSVTTFGGDYREDMTTGRKSRHVSNFSTSTTTSMGAAAAASGGMKRVDSWKARDTVLGESFQGGLAALSALNMSRGSGSPGSSSSDPASRPLSKQSNPQIRTPYTSLGEEDAPIDVQKELELLRRDREKREKMERRASTASVMSNMSTKTTGTFRGAGSKIMDVSASDVMDDELAEMAGERLLGSVGDGLEALAFGKRKGSRLGLGSANNSRPGSSAGITRKTSTSGLASHSTGITSQSSALSSSVVQSPEMEDEADITITLPRASALSAPSPNPNLNRESILSFYGGSPDESIETFETGRVGSGSTFVARLSAEMDSRSSNGSSFGQHLMMKDSSSMGLPRVMVEDITSGKTKTGFSRAFPDNHEEISRKHGQVLGREKDDGQERLINITVWNDAPITPRAGESNWSHSSSIDQERRSIDQYVAPANNNQTSASLSPSARPSLESTLTARFTRSPSPSGTSFHSHSTVKPNQPGTSSAKPSIDLDRPDSAMSSASRGRFPAPPALSLSRATPLSSETELALHDDEDDVLASPSAGRDRGKTAGSGGTHKTRPSEDFANQMQMDMEKEGMHSEFAFLQDVAIREKRLKLALFGRAAPHTISRPNTRRPQSMAAITKKLPGSPDSERANGASSPEIEEMIKRGKRSLGKAMRRRRSTGALHPYASADWRRSDMDLALGVPSRTSDATLNEDWNGRRALELNRDSVRVRDSVVDLPDEDKVGFPEMDDPTADSDSSIDIHTPLVSFLFADLFDDFLTRDHPASPHAPRRAIISSFENPSSPNTRRDFQYGLQERSQGPPRQAKYG